MRNLKKILAMALALVMSLSLVTIANASDFSDDADISYKEAVDVMSAIGVINGYEDGSFQPDGILTREEAALLQELDGCRSDLVRYTSALQGMSTSQRLILFNQVSFMADWFHKLRPIAEEVSDFLTAIREQNRVPSTPKSEEEK